MPGRGVGTLSLPQFAAIVPPFVFFVAVGGGQAGKIKRGRRSGAGESVKRNGVRSQEEPSPQRVDGFFHRRATI